MRVRSHMYYAGTNHNRFGSRSLSIKSLLARGGGTSMREVRACSCPTTERATPGKQTPTSKAPHYQQASLPLRILGSWASGRAELARSRQPPTSTGPSPADPPSPPRCRSYSSGDRQSQIAQRNLPGEEKKWSKAAMH